MRAARKIKRPITMIVIRYDDCAGEQLNRFHIALREAFRRMRKGGR